MYKIAIISRKGLKNYGNALQLVALSTAISDLGYEPVIADYEYHGWLKSYRPVMPLKWAANQVSKRLMPRNRPDLTELYDEARREKFRLFFAKWANLSDEATTASDLFALSEECDAFISGSDQVFAPMWYDPHYFLDFLTKAPRKSLTPPALAATISALPQSKRRCHAPLPILRTFPCVKRAGRRSSNS